MFSLGQKNFARAASLRRATCRAAVLPRSLAVPVMKADDAHTRNRHFLIAHSNLNFNLPY